MALKDLTTPTLLTILDGWLDPAGNLPVLKGLERTAPLVRDLETARTALQASHAADNKASPEVQKLRGRAAEVDAKHDRKARGLDKVLDGLSELTDDAAFSAQLATLRTEILGPKGLSVISSSYTDEAQNAKLVDTRLTKESKSVLKEVMLLDQPLAKWVKQWQGVAAELGEIDAERTAAEAKGATKAQPADAVRARNLTIRTINAVLSMIEMEAPAAETRTSLLAKVEEALAKADRRGRKGTKDEEAGGDDTKKDDAKKDDGNEKEGQK